MDTHWLMLSGLESSQPETDAGDQAFKPIMLATDRHHVVQFCAS